MNTISPDIKVMRMSAQLESFEFPERTTNDIRQKNRHTALTTTCEFKVPDL